MEWINNATQQKGYVYVCVMFIQPFTIIGIPSGGRTAWPGHGHGQFHSSAASTLACDSRPLSEEKMERKKSVSKGGGGGGYYGGYQNRPYSEDNYQRDQGYDGSDEVDSSREQGYVSRPYSNDDQDKTSMDRTYFKRTNDQPSAPPADGSDSYDNLRQKLKEMDL